MKKCCDKPQIESGAAKIICWECRKESLVAFRDMNIKTLKIIIKECQEVIDRKEEE